jgi:GT2 family glycosyltransferase
MQASAVKTSAEGLIDVIIVNFNAGEALLRCIQSVLSQDMPVRLTVVDNASSDGSDTLMARRFGQLENVRLINSESNPGFATAVNSAVRELEKPVLADTGAEAEAEDRAQSTGESQYLLILNPDCEMQPGSLRGLSRALDDDPRAALAGPMVVDGAGQVMRGTLRRFPDPWRSFLTFTGLWRLGRWIPAWSGVEMSSELPAETTVAEAVSGACMLVRKEAFLGAGGMDGAYGLHCEDLDLMYRLRQKNHHSLFVPGARVFHQQGVSSRSRPLWAHRQKHLGMQRFFLKFQAQRRAFPLRWLVIAGIWLRYAITLPLVWFRG